MKRSTDNRRNSQELKADGNNLYRIYEKYPSEVKPVFKRAHYPKTEVKQ